MGKVAVIYRIMPTSVDVDLEKVLTDVRKNLPADTNLRGSQIKDVAFGIKALMIQVIMNDVEGISDNVQETIAKIKDVESVEVLEMTLI